MVLLANLKSLLLFVYILVLVPFWVFSKGKYLNLMYIPLHCMCLCTHHPSLYTPPLSVHTTRLFTHRPSLYTPPLSVHTTPLCTHHPSLYTPPLSVHTTPLCTHYPSLYTLPLSTNACHHSIIFHHFRSYTLSIYSSIYNL